MSPPSANRRSSTGKHTEELPALTSLRFFAALHVVAHHYLMPLVESRPLLETLVSYGYSSVSFFYVLSGFVLTHVYRYEETPAAPTRRRFWWKRFARIYPIYFVALIAYAPFVIEHRFASGRLLTASTKLLVSAGVNLAALQAWLPQLSSSWNAPSWSISVEVFFYLVFPWLCPWLLRRPRPLRALAVTWLLGVSLPTLAIALHLSPATASPSAAVLAPYLRYSPLLHLPSFAFGILLRKLRDETRISAIWLPIGLLLLGVTVCLAPSALRPVLRSTGLLPFFGILLLAASNPRSKLTSPLHHPCLVFLGDASYSLYILQVPVWLWLWPILSPVGGSAARLAYLVSVVVIAVLAHVWIEIPVRSWLMRGRPPKSRREGTVG